MTMYVQLAVLALSLIMVFIERWFENSPERKRKQADDVNQAFADAVVNRDVDTIAVMLNKRLRGIL